MRKCHKIKEIDLTVLDNLESIDKDFLHECKGVKIICNEKIKNLLSVNNNIEKDHKIYI
jgi:hypothetical protein